MPQRDTMDKVVNYFAAFTNHPFTYGGREYTVRPLRVTPSLLRGFTCPSRCGGCCPRFSLDYLPSEQGPLSVERRDVVLNGRHVEILSDVQADHKGHHCRYLNTQGRCSIHGHHPFSCDFELIRLAQHKDFNLVNTRLFGRGWAMLRVDGDRGAKCSITPATDQTISEVVRKLTRLNLWMCHFNLYDNRVEDVITYAESSPTRSATITQEGITYD